MRDGAGATTIARRALNPSCLARRRNDTCDDDAALNAAEDAIKDNSRCTALSRASCAALGAQWRTTTRRRRDGSDDGDDGDDTDVDDVTCASGH
jgi:hypothetical protein